MITPKKILVVDDEKLIVQAYGDHFRNEGYEIGEAYDGVEALEKMQTFKPDIILLDILMPKLDGISVLKKLKADPATAHIPVIILTNLETKENVIEALELGSLYFVKSNLSLERVGRWIQELLKEKTP